MSTVPETTPLLDVHRLVKVYNSDNARTYALNDVSLQVEAGEFLVIQGPSGGGKSTLLRILGLLEAPTQGSLRVAGHDVGRLGDEQSAWVRNHKLGFIFQSFNLVAHLNVVENVMLPLSFRHKARYKSMREVALRALAAVDLEQRAGASPQMLSGGQQQRVSIARALVNSPEVIFADEPTGNLDSENSVKIMDIFKELNTAGRTIVMVTHDHALAIYGSRCVVLRDGQIETASNSRPISHTKPNCPGERKHSLAI